MERSIKIFNVTYVIRAHAAMRSLQKNVPDSLIVKTVETGNLIMQEHGTDKYELQHYDEERQIWRMITVIIKQEEQAVVTVWVTNLD
jgi:hypothetical protein